MKRYKRKVGLNPNKPLYSVSVDNIETFFSSSYFTAFYEFQRYYMGLGKGEVHMYKQDSVMSEKMLII